MAVRSTSLQTESPDKVSPGTAVLKRLPQITGGALLAATYWTVIRPRMLNWGATPTEIQRSLPGDDLLSDPDGKSTMAISIEGSPSDVWSWLVQLGQARGGFYSYEWAENLVGLGIHNVDEIKPELQNLNVGDEVRLGRADRFPDATLEVAALEPERSLVLESPDDPPWWVWSFVLESVDTSTTRLLVRSRIRVPENPVVRLASHVVLEPVTFAMTSGMLKGIRSRVEGREPSRLERMPKRNIVPRPSSDIVDD